MHGKFKKTSIRCDSGCRTGKADVQGSFIFQRDDRTRAIVMMAMWFGGESDVSGNAFITLPKLFSAVLPSPRPLLAELWNIVPEFSSVLSQA